MDECPICLTTLAGAVTQTGCCQKTMHAKCYVKCILVKPACPMCRASQETLELQSVIVPVPVVQTPNQMPTPRTRALHAFMAVLFYGGATAYITTR